MATEEEKEKTIAFVLYPGLTALDMVGPLQAIAALEMAAPQFRPVVVGERIEEMEADSSLKLTPSKTFDEVPDPFVLLVPGGVEPTIRAMANEAILDYIRSAAGTAEVVGSICTGSLILGAAGLLEGRRATTHWACAGLLERLGARYVPERWVEDGKFITAAGGTAGIDMALHLVARLADEATSRFVQLWIEYDPQPPFGGIDWSQVDRDMFAPMVAQTVKNGLADHPDLLAKLSG